MTEPLAYAPPPRRRFRRPIMWTMIGLFAVILAMPLITGFWHWADERLELRRVQNACRTFRAPPEVVVHFEDMESSVPPKDPRYDGSLNVYEIRSSHGPSRSLQNVLALSQLHFAMKSPLPGRSATLFLHERTSRDGQTVIVGVSGTAETMWSASLFADVLVAEPASLLSNAPPRGSVTQVEVMRWPLERQAIRIYASQPDPADASRFTIDYQFGDARGVIDGKLNDDLSVTLTVRDGPLAQTKR